MTDSMKLSPRSSTSAHNAVYKVAISRCEEFPEERLANWLVRMVELDLRIAPILGDPESDLRLCFTSGKMLVYYGAFGRRHLICCLLFIVLFRLSSWHLCVSKRPRAANTRSDRA